MCAKTTRTSQIMKWTGVKHPNCEVVLGAADKSKKYPTSCMTPTSVKMLNLLIASTELKEYEYKPVIMQKHANITYVKYKKQTSEA